VIQAVWRGLGLLRAPYFLPLSLGSGRDRFDGRGRPSLHWDLTGEDARRSTGFQNWGAGLARIGIPALGRHCWSYFFRIIIPYEASPESSQIWCDGWHLAAMSFALHSSLIRLARFIRGKVALAFPDLESQGSAMRRATQHFLAVSPDRKRT